MSAGNTAFIVCMALVAASLFGEESIAPPFDIPASPSSVQRTPDGPADVRDLASQAASEPHIFGAEMRRDKSRQLKRPIRVLRGTGVRFDEQAMDLALHWLAYHQSDNGSWDVIKWEGRKSERQDAAALALLAFLQSGQTEKIGKDKESVRKAVAWLTSIQMESGRIGGDKLPPDPLEKYRALCEHALSTLALCEAAGMANIPATRAAAQKALDYFAAQRLFEDILPALSKNARLENTDIEGLGWIFFVIKSGKVAGLNVPAGLTDAALQFLEKHNTGADLRLFGRERNVLDTLVLACCLQVLGFNREDTQPALEWVLTQKHLLPPYEKGSERTDCGILYFGSCAFLQQRGKLWKTWDKGRRDSVIDTASSGFETLGSWDPAGTWKLRGRVHATAIMSMVSRMYLRWPSPEDVD